MTRHTLRERDVSAELETYLAANAERHLAELTEFLAIPSVSALREHAADMRRCAEWTAAAMHRAGLERARVIETGGAPLAYGDWLHAPGAPTVLVYGHYDVQPADPVDAWTSPPFVATARDGKLYARGATDDKGQLFIHLKSAEAWLAAAGRLPVNLKVLIEGEEEVGSAHLESFVREHAPELAADVIIESDSAMLAPRLPSIGRAMRGIACFRLDARTGPVDLHSGTFGGVVANAALVMSALLASLKDAAGRIRIPGFYDDVRPLTDADRQELAAIPLAVETFGPLGGSFAYGGEPGYSAPERLWARPTLDVNGIQSGFTGERLKTVIPCTATAMLSIRLVPDQSPDRVGDLLEAHLAATAAALGVRDGVRLTRLHSGRPWELPADDPWLRAAARAMAYGFGREPVLSREGGSNPILPVLEEAIGARTIMFGIGLPDENAHAPDEHLHLDNLHRGMRAAARLYQDLADAAARRFIVTPARR